MKTTRVGNRSFVFPCLLLSFGLLFGGGVGCGGSIGQAQTPQTPNVETSPENSGGEEIPTTETPPEEVVDTMPPLMSPPTGEELLYPLSQGSPAPWTGVLLNPAAVAWLEAEPLAVQERAQAFLDRRLQQVRLLSTTEIQRLQLRASTLEEVHQIALRARDEQIEALNRINEELRRGPLQWWEQVLWIGGALIVGIAVGIIVGVVAGM